MPSGADLFVVCKQCGSEVSPYVTECPYCGNRVRRRAPDLPKEKDVPARARSRRPSLPGRPHLPRSKKAKRAAAGSRLAGSGFRLPDPRSRRDPRGRRSAGGLSLRAGSRPYATIALVALSCAGWILIRGGYLGSVGVGGLKISGTYASFTKIAIFGPLDGEWWRLFSAQFAYLNGLYGFVTVLALAIFGWLLERRRGPAVVIAVFLGAGATGALVASAVYAEPLVSGANGAALGLLAAWAVPDLLDARAGNYYEGDLLGVAALAALLLAMPFARPEASWLAGLTGAVIGLVLGYGVHRLGSAES